MSQRSDGILAQLCNSMNINFHSSFRKPISFFRIHSFKFYCSLYYKSLLEMASQSHRSWPFNTETAFFASKQKKY